MPRGIDSRFDPNRRVGRHGVPFTDGNTIGNAMFAAQRETYQDDLEAMMSEHPTGMPPRKVKMVDKGMSEGTSAARIQEGSLRKWNDPSIVKDK